MNLTVARLDDEARRRHHGQRVIWDEGTGAAKGLSVLVSRGSKRTGTSTISFRVVFSLKDRPGKVFYKNLGRFCTDADLQGRAECLRAARRQAGEIRELAARGIDPNRPKAKSGKFKDMVDSFIERHAKPNQRTWQETKRILDLYAVARFGDKEVENLTWKGDINPLLDEIAAGKYDYKSGKKIGTKAVARSVNSQLVAFFNWFAENHASEGFRPPIVKTKKLNDWKAGARERVLSDSEIRTLWQACKEIDTPYAGMIKCALLTAQRVDKVCKMRWSDLKPFLTIPSRLDIQTNEWLPEQRVPHVWDASRATDPKNKKVSVVPLSDMAREVIETFESERKEAEQEYVFSREGSRSLEVRELSEKKALLDDKMLEIMRRDVGEEDRDKVKIEPWQHRDLRRTARTLMARAGVNDLVAEQCLAHTLPAIQATYNRHGYLAEKQDAFRKLAELIERIINPRYNVTRLGDRRTPKGEALSGRTL